MTAMALLDDYLTREQLAQELKATVRTIMRWENMPDGLPRVNVGGKILYRKSSVAAWLERRERQRNPVRRGAA